MVKDFYCGFTCSYKLTCMSVIFTSLYASIHSFTCLFLGPTNTLYPMFDKQWIQTKSTGVLYERNCAGE